MTSDFFLSTAYNDFQNASSIKENEAKMATSPKSKGPGTTDLPKLSQPAHRALASVGISNLTQLSRHTEKEIADLHGMGPKGINELKRALRAKGLNFAAAKKKGS
jgi:hypothetical protein